MPVERHPLTRDPAQVEPAPDDVRQADPGRRSSDVNRAVLAALYRRDTRHTLLVLVGQVSAVVVVAIAAEAIDASWATCLAVLVIGTRQYGLGEVLVHEASHHNLSRHRWINTAIGTALSWPFFFTFAGYRRFHLQHHQVPLDDPRNSIIEEYQDWRLPLSAEAVSRRRLIWLIFLRPLTGVIALYHLIGIASDAYYDADLKENTCMWLFWAVVVALCWHLGVVEGLILYWLAPLFLVFATLNYWSEVGDHYRTSDLLTRSNIGPGWNVLIAGNVGYHVVHHKYPRIPWFRLKAAHALLGGSLPGQTSTSLFAAFAQMRQGHQHVVES